MGEKRRPVVVVLANDFMPRIAEKSNELIHQLNTLTTEDIGDSFLLKRIEREAKNLQQTDALGSYMVFGALACLKKDLQQVKDYYEKAIRLAPNDGWVENSRAIALFKLCQFMEAKVSAQRAYDLSQKSDLAALKILIDASLLMGQLLEACTWLKEWDKKSPEHRYPLGKEIAMAERTFQQYKLTDQETSEFIQVAYDILYQKNRRTDTVDFLIIDNEPFYRIRVAGEAEEIADLNFDLADALAERDFIPRISQALGVMYLPALARS